jgi:hypothetical protein
MKAFPQKAPKDLNKPADNYTNPLDRGMDLRDYFASRAMQALLPTYPNHLKNTSRFGIANDSYTMADAMMLAREGLAHEEPVKTEPQFGDPVIKMEEPPKPIKKVVKKNGTN